MENKKHLTSIDFMRGLTLFLMLFVNDLFVPGVPTWLVHTKADTDGMGLADWVFPGFLFMVGLSIPFAISARIAKGEKVANILLHIINRTVALLIIGVIMVNIDRFSAEASAINKTVWVVLAYISFFLIWNKYPKNKFKSFNISQLKYLGIILLVTLAFLFRAEAGSESTWLITSWWGILGIIGWAYFTASIVYLVVKDRILYCMIFLIGFVLLNIGNQINIFEISKPFSTIFGVIIHGNAPSIAISGMFVGVLIRKFRHNSTLLLKILLALGIVYLIIGFVLRHWFIISKIKGTPSWVFICTGISILVFGLIYFLVEISGKGRWFSIFAPAGENSLTTYLMPDIIYYLLWALPFKVFIYKQMGSPLLAVLGSICWSLSMIILAKYLVKIGVRLKL